MLNIPSEVKALFQQDGVHKNFHVHFPNGDNADLNNEDILQESVQFTESLCSQEYFKFGLAEASQIEFTAVGIPNILGSTIECAIEIDCASLGDAWASDHPVDDTLDWLEPQPYYFGSYKERKSGDVIELEVPTGDTATIKEFEIDYSPTTMGGIGSLKIYVNSTQSTSGATVYDIDISSAGTVYGCTFDAFTGVLTVTNAYVNLKDLAWSYSGTSQFFMSFGLNTDIFPHYDLTEKPEMYCNGYPVMSYDMLTETVGTPLKGIAQFFTNNRQYLYVHDSGYTNATAFKNALESNHVALRYKLKTPLTYNLSPVVFSQLTGTKYLWASYGEVTGLFSVVPNSPKLYYRVPYGRFIVDSCPRDHGAMYNRKIVAYTGENYKNVPYLPGQFPTSNIKINPAAWLVASQLKESDMTFVEYVAQGSRMWRVDLWAGSTAAPSLNGILGIIKASYPGLLQPLISLNQSIYAVKIDYDEHEYDQYAQAFFDKAKASLPSGNFYYYTNNDNVGIKTFSDVGQAVSEMTCLFSPSFYVRVAYRNPNTDVTCYCFTRPVFIKPGEMYILDLRNFDGLSFCLKVPSGYTEFVGMSLIVSVPMQWENAASWEWITSQVEAQYKTVTGWSDVAPFEQRVERRSGSVKIYYKDIGADVTALPNATIQNTLSFTKGSLGSYYTYSNAVSTLGMLGGAMELLGKFWKTERNGDEVEFAISENQAATPIARSQWEEFWWDENDVSDIGVVNVQSSDDGSSAATQFTIGTGSSVYTMDDNDYLKNVDNNMSDILTALNTYFKPNAEVVNFTPVDLKMKGLPYLEAGDKIQLTADDGSTVDTYILEQTISGIQHLRADVSSMNGELLKVDENE